MANSAQSFSDASGHYSSVKSDAESRAVRWEYCVTDTWNWHPDALYQLQRHNWPRLTSSQGAYWAYGYDSSDRLVVMKEINRSKFGTEVFVNYDGDKQAGVKFRDGILQELFTVLTEDGRVIEVRCQLENQVIVSGYRWQNGKPVAKTTKFEDGEIYEDIVDGNWNIIEQWKIKRDGKRVPANPELPKGTSIKTLSTKLAELLPKAIQAVLREAKIAEPVYCLCLAYDGENPGLSLACVAVGLETEREKILAKNPKHVSEQMWNPAEFAYYDKPAVHIVNEELVQLCEWFNQLVEAKDSVEPVRKLLIDVAAQMAKADLGKTLHQTNDFVVYAVDYYLADLQKNMKKTVPPHMLKQFKKRSWI